MMKLVFVVCIIILCIRTLCFHSLHTVASSPPEVHAYQEGPTVINVRWDHPDPLNETIGYQIYYTGTTNGSLAADDIVSNNYTIAGLVNGGSYNISVAGKSAHLESSRTEAQENRIVLSKFLCSYAGLSHKSLSY